MRSIICAFRSALKETIQCEIKAAIQSVLSEFDEMTTCREVTGTEPDPGMMQYIEEHQEIPKEDATVMPVGGPRKWCRVCNLTAEHHQKMKKRPKEIEDPGKVGCHLQEGVLLCKSGMMKMKPLQENGNHGKV
jgi:hypothetical protein